MINIFNTEGKIVDPINELVDTIIQTNISGLNRLIRNHERNFKLIWNHPEITPQEIFDKFGESAIQLFQASAATQQYIQAVKPDYEPLVPPYNFEINEDGTVTVGEKIGEELPEELL